MRTLEEILEKEASEMIAARDSINKMVADSKVDMPLLVTLPAWWDEELPKWSDLEWEKSFLIDTDIDERAEYWCVTATADGVTYEGTGTYIHDTLEIVEEIEIKKL